MSSLSNNHFEDRPEECYDVPYTDPMGYIHWRAVRARGERQAKIKASIYRCRNWLMGEPVKREA